MDDFIPDDAFDIQDDEVPSDELEQLQAEEPEVLPPAKRLKRRKASVVEPSAGPSTVVPDVKTADVKTADVKTADGSTCANESGLHRYATRITNEKGAVTRVRDVDAANRISRRCIDDVIKQGAKIRAHRNATKERSGGNPKFASANAERPVSPSEEYKWKRRFETLLNKWTGPKMTGSSDSEITKVLPIGFSYAVQLSSGLSGFLELKSKNNESRSDLNYSALPPDCVSRNWDMGFQFNVEPEIADRSLWSSLDRGTPWSERHRSTAYGNLLTPETINRKVMVFLADVRNWNRKVKRSQEAAIRIAREEADHVVDPDAMRNPEIGVETEGPPSIVLLAGPPGVGKTTLALAAVQASSFQLVQINASDERSERSLSSLLDCLTRGSSLLSDPTKGKEGDFAVVLDEADGMDAAAVRYLLRNRAKSCERRKRVIPLIATCNDQWTRGLAPLRAQAIVIDVNSLDSQSVIQRIKSICKLENFVVEERHVCSILAAQAQMDLREVLTALQTAAMRHKSSTGNAPTRFDESDLQLIREDFDYQDRQSRHEVRGLLGGESPLETYRDKPLPTRATFALCIETLLRSARIGHQRHVYGLSGLLRLWVSASLTYWDTSVFVRCQLALRDLLGRSELLDGRSSEAKVIQATKTLPNRARGERNRNLQIYEDFRTRVQPVISDGSQRANISEGNVGGCTSWALKLQEPNCRHVSTVLSNLLTGRRGLSSTLPYLQEYLRAVFLLGSGRNRFDAIGDSDNAIKTLRSFHSWIKSSVHVSDCGSLCSGSIPPRLRPVVTWFRLISHFDIRFHSECVFETKRKSRPADNQTSGQTAPPPFMVPSVSSIGCTDITPVVSSESDRPGSLQAPSDRRLFFIPGALGIAQLQWWTTKPGSLAHLDLNKEIALRGGQVMGAGSRTEEGRRGTLGLDHQGVSLLAFLRGLPQAETLLVSSSKPNRLQRDEDDCGETEEIHTTGDHLNSELLSIDGWVAMITKAAEVLSPDGVNDIVSIFTFTGSSKAVRIQASPKDLCPRLIIS